MQKVKISVIVPVYNSELFLEKCINSLINQTYKNIEIILVNDGSIDNSGKICDEYEIKDKRIKVIHKINGGVSSARNAGLMVAKGEYILFVDSDDYIEKNMLDLLLKTSLKENSDIVICNIYYRNINGREIFSYSHSNFAFGREEFPRNMYYISSISGYVCNKLYKKNLIYNNSSFINFNNSISICEDDLFNYEVFLKNKEIKISYIDNKLYNYVINKTSATQKRFNDNKLSYFYVKEFEINCLKKEEYNYDYLIADYLINFVRTTLIMKKNKAEKNKKYIVLLNKFNKYKKELNFKNISLNLKIKVVIALYLPFIYMIKLYIKNEFN